LNVPLGAIVLETAVGRYDQTAEDLAPLHGGRKYTLGLNVMAGRASEGGFRPSTPCRSRADGRDSPRSFAGHDGEDTISVNVKTL
jgi:hypothetical protein